MQVRFTSYLGKEGFGEQFLGECEIGGAVQPCSIRWAAEPRPDGGKDTALARVRDAGLLMQLYPDPLAPRVLAVVPCWNGLAVVSELPGGIKLSEIEQRPLPEAVILEIVRQICLMLDRVYTRKDANTGEMLRTLHRAISTECIHLRPDGGIRVTGFEKMSTVWSARAAETSALATHPGARLAPEQMAGEVFHATDVYLAGLVAVDLLVNPERASQTARLLAMCICDPEGFEEIREQVLSDDTVEATTNLRGLLRAMLQEDPKSRPSGHVISSMAAAVGASEPALRAFAASLPAPPPLEGLFHQFVGRSLDVADPELRPMPDEQGAEPPAPAAAAPVQAPQPAPVAATPAAPTAELFDDEPTPAPAAPKPAVRPPAPPPGATVTPRAKSFQPPPRAEAPAAPKPEAPAAPKPAAPAAPAAAKPAAPAPAAPAAPAPPAAKPTAAPVPAKPAPPPALDETGEPLPQPVKPSSRPPEPAVPLAAKPAPVTPIAAGPVAPPAREAPAPAPRKKSKLPLILGAGLLLFVLGVFACGGGFALFYFLG